jgi:hypothetical protein
MGANDLCTSSTATMTSVNTFRSQFEQTLATLKSGAPNARVYVASIPNVYHLWEPYRSDLVAQSVWAAAGICQSLLSLSNTSTQRDAVRTRNATLNTVLAQECAAYANCRFDRTPSTTTASARVRSASWTTSIPASPAKPPSRPSRGLRRGGPPPDPAQHRRPGRAAERSRVALGAWALLQRDARVADVMLGPDLPDRPHDRPGAEDDQGGQ